MEFIRQLINPVGLSAGDKFMASLMVAVIGMSITFLALMILMLAIKIMTAVLAPKENKAKEDVAASAAPVVVKSEPQTDDSELVAVITAAIAASLNKPMNQIIVNKIVRVPDQKPAWAKNGLADQMKNY